LLLLQEDTPPPVELVLLVPLDSVATDRLAQQSMLALIILVLVLVPIYLRRLVIMLLVVLALLALLDTLATDRLALTLMLALITRVILALFVPICYPPLLIMPLDDLVLVPPNNQLSLDLR